MAKISACLVVYNEERNIDRCLKSLAGVVDEIILVHDGPCQDQTLALAAAYGAKIFIRQHFGQAELHRPFSFEQASHDWILQIDADEFLSAELRSQLPSLSTTDHFSAYKFIWPLWDGKKIVSRVWPQKIAFFRKDKISLWGVPHFIPIISGPVGFIKKILQHQPSYNNFTFHSFVSKQTLWAKIQAQCYLSDFREIAKFNEIRNTWPRSIKLRVAYPLLLLPLEFILVFFRTILSGAWRAGSLGFKSALLAASYRAAVDYYIFKFKK